MSKLNPNGRRYDVSGVVLAEIGKDAKEYTVGGTWKFSGYSKGYGVNANSESTLKCDGATNLETVRLNVYETTYRSSSSVLGPGHKNDITSVYFAVPKRLLDDYGRLQKIKAEWFEYKTNPVIVVNDIEIYKKFIRF